MFVSDLRQDNIFFLVSSTKKKTVRHNITEILLKVALNTNPRHNVNSGMSKLYT